MCQITHSPAFLATRLAESEAENDQWQKKLAETWAEVERLKTDPYKAGYIDGQHDAHARRDELATAWTARIRSARTR
jgi:hypothetical protein